MEDRFKWTRTTVEQIHFEKLPQTQDDRWREWQRPRRRRRFHNLFWGNSIRRWVIACPFDEQCSDQIHRNAIEQDTDETRMDVNIKIESEMKSAKVNRCNMIYKVRHGDALKKLDAGFIFSSHFFSICGSKLVTSVGGGGGGEAMCAL